MTELFLLLLLNSGLALFCIIWFGLIKPETPMRSKKDVLECLFVNSMAVVVGIAGLLLFAGLYAGYQEIDSFIKLPWEE